MQTAVVLLTSCLALALSQYVPDNHQCGVTHNPPVEPMDWRITNGDPAQHGTWPWQVSLQLGSNHFCGGSIITDRHVLTAAHCFFDPLVASNMYALTVKMGEHKLHLNEQTEQVIGVKKVKVHEGYAGRRASDPHDIALVTLQRPIRFSQYVRKVCLDEWDVFEDSQDCWLTGWGRTESGADQRHLQEVRGFTITNYECSRRMGRWLNPGQLCFGQGVRGACNGDSGGPMVCRRQVRGQDLFFQAGIVSFGNKACSTGPSVLTRVAKYVDWIQQNM